MVPGCGGAGDSSESHDTDIPPDELDSPPVLRRRGKTGIRPHSDLLNQILIDKFKVSGTTSYEWYGDVYVVYLSRPDDLVLFSPPLYKYSKTFTIK